MCHIVASSQATPMPRKTLIVLLPVTLLIEASAWISWTADTLLAKRSGRLVPKATKAKAVTLGDNSWCKLKDQGDVHYLQLGETKEIQIRPMYLSLRPTVHPRWDATSP